jgi:hypothetical protein
VERSLLGADERAGRRAGRARGVREDLVGEQREAALAGERPQRREVRRVDEGARRVVGMD